MLFRLIINNLESSIFDYSTY